jgi:hypothetical protein
MKVDSDGIVHRLTTDNINCSDQFQNILTSLKSLNEKIYIVCRILPSEGILSLVKKMDKVQNTR